MDSEGREINVIATIKKKNGASLTCRLDGRTNMLTAN